MSIALTDAIISGKNLIKSRIFSGSGILIISFNP